MTERGNRKITAYEIRRGEEGGRRKGKWRLNENVFIWVRRFEGNR